MIFVCRTIKLVAVKGQHREQTCFGSMQELVTAARYSSRISTCAVSRLKCAEDDWGASPSQRETLDRRDGHCQEAYAAQRRGLQPEALLGLHVNAFELAEVPWLGGRRYIRVGEEGKR